MFWIFQLAVIEVDSVRSYENDQERRISALSDYINIDTFGLYIGLFEMKILPEPKHELIIK